MKKSLEKCAAVCYNEDAVNEADSLKGEEPMRQSDTKRAIGISCKK